MATEPLCGNFGNLRLFYILVSVFPYKNFEMSIFTASVLSRLVSVPPIRLSYSFNVYSLGLRPDACLVRGLGVKLKNLNYL